MKFETFRTALPLLLTIIMSNASFAAEIVPSAIPKAAGTDEQFCPAGWKIESKLTADLQGVGAKDQIIELITQKSSKNSNGANTNYRALVVAFAKDGKLELADYATKFLLNTMQGGQLGANVAISREKNGFSVDQSGGGGNDSWEYNLSFKFDKTKNQFVVTKAVVTKSTDRVSNNNTETSYDYERGLETVTVTVDDKEKKTTKKFAPKSITLRELDAEKLPALFKG
ncbi:MAG TPA: hypothetical protein V6C76_14895 [Drouetiella sp.]